MLETFADFLIEQCSHRQMTLGEDALLDALHSIDTRSADEPVDITAPIASIVCSRGVMGRFIGTSAFSETVRRGETRLLISAVELAEALNRAALRYAHGRLGAFHIVLAMIECRRSEFEVMLLPFAQAYQRNYPNGSLQQQRMRKLMQQFSDPAMAGELEFLVVGTPYDINRLREQLDFYLGSRFYPYEALNWKQFLEADDLTRNDPLLLRAFVAQGWETLSAVDVPRESAKPAAGMAKKQDPSRRVGIHRKVRSERGLLDETIFKPPAAPASESEKTDAAG